ncbi:uncharacterized protein LOC117779550 [Drosophila innubila]|uniref:uncharacterized protein LOC117779550 n=1 Tax=Drosophila innubila TaxID=198719 RepID=UPI00148D8E51|nr:uncharacterized protein LOC117779550 [Drosophila innubila]
MENRSERKQELPCQSFPNLSLNPLASEFIPSYLKNSSNSKPYSKMSPGPKKSKNSQNMKSKTTSTTTLVRREVVGDASYLHAQRQLFELLHQLGNKFMPLKAIDVSLSPDGQGINVQFKGEQGTLAKQMLDENLCLDASLHLEISERSFMPRKLPNVLAANFMARMGDVLNDKMEWNEQSDVTNCPSTTTTIDSDITQENRSKRIKSSVSSLASEISKTHKISSSILGTTTIPKKQLELTNPNTSPTVMPEIMTLPKLSQITKIPTPIGGWNGVKTVDSRTEMRQRSGNAKQDSQHDKKSIKGRPTPRKSIGQSIKKNTQKLAPRGTYTSLMRQTEAQKRLSLLKDDNN